MLEFSFAVVVLSKNGLRLLIGQGLISINIASEGNIASIHSSLIEGIHKNAVSNH